MQTFCNPVGILSLGVDGMGFCFMIVICVCRCSVSQWKEERNFWIFEGVTFAIGVLSYGLVVIRQHRLDRMLREKIDRQIAADI